MRVYISVDMEGIAGVVHESQTDPTTPAFAAEYGRFRRLMTAEANAAGEGTFDGGVRLRRHEAPEPPVFGGERRRCRIGLGLVDDPGDSLHVDGDVDAHRVKAISRRCFVLQST